MVLYYARIVNSMKYLAKQMCYVRKESQSIIRTDIAVKAKGERMSNKDINYDKKTNYRYTSHASRYANYAERKELRATPTQEMLRLNKFLVELCKENGIGRSEYECGWRDDRSGLFCMNYEMMDRLREIGVDSEKLWKEKPKFKFDKDGNVINAHTGKIVKRRTE